MIYGREKAKVPVWLINTAINTPIMPTTEMDDDKYTIEIYDDWRE